jgi:hypothetical protein
MGHVSFLHCSVSTAGNDSPGEMKEF